MDKTLPFTDFTVNGKNYMLRLTALSAVRLEERLGCSIYEGAKRLSEVTVATEFLFALIESLRPEITRGEVYTIFDEYISEGGSLRKLNGIIAQALGASGFFDTGGEESPPQK